MSAAPISATERAAVVEAFGRENARPLPKDWSPVARLIAIALLVGAFTSGRIAGLLHLPKLALMIALGLAGAIAFVIGLINFAESEAGSRAEAAIERLGRDFATMSAEEKRTAAASLLVNAFFSGGPYMRETIDLKRVRERLGASLPYVEAVEEVLVAEKKLYRVVTSKAAMAKEA